MTTIISTEERVFMFDNVSYHTETPWYHSLSYDLCA